MSIGSGLASMGNDIAAAMQDYHKKHVEYDKAYGLADALSRLGVNEAGQVVPMDAVDESGKKVKSDPLIDPRVLQSVTSQFKGKREAATGALEALTRIGMGTAQRMIAQKIEDASLSGQRTKQIIGQDETMFPLDVEQKKAQTKHLQKITDDEGKVNVPGFGLMTPAQYSAHLSRQERMEILKKKSEPILNFENQLKNAYGLGIQDIVDASQPQEFTVDEGGRFSGKKLKKVKGTPYFDLNGTQVSAEQAAQKPQETFVLAGPNKIPIPLIDTEHGLGWKQIIGKAKGFSGEMETLGKEQENLTKQQAKLQAQQVIAVLRGRDESQLEPEEQAALAKARAILSQ